MPRYASAFRVSISHPRDGINSYTLLSNQPLAAVANPTPTQLECHLPHTFGMVSTVQLKHEALQCIPANIHLLLLVINVIVRSTSDHMIPSSIAYMLFPGPTQNRQFTLPSRFSNCRILPFNFMRNGIAPRTREFAIMVQHPCRHGIAGTSELTSEGAIKASLPRNGTHIVLVLF